ncbi:MAG: ThuA domain-containing protein [Chitinophagaceae bacterium]|nr:ThuA domain-containing protein [Chitinophagaceae bacterium]
MRKIAVSVFAMILMLPEAYAKAEDDAMKAYKKPPHIVFLITEDTLNYNAHVTIPAFAKYLEEHHGYKVTVLSGEGDRASCHFPGMDVLSKADLLAVFCRRVALSPKQLKTIKNYIKKGRPVIGIRTANHAFSFLETPAEGFAAWPGFVDSILGCKNRGYGPVLPGTEVSVAPDAADHPVLKGITPAHWHSNGNVYLVAPLLDKKARVLLNGTAEENTQPVAWTRYSGKSRVFYTSLGYPDDFSLPQFRQLLINGIQWALSK